MGDVFKPILAITMGDAAGIGGEIIDKALSRKEVYDLSRPLVVGDTRVLKNALQVAHVQLQFNPVEKVADAIFRHGVIDVLDLKSIDTDNLVMGKPQAMAGKASVEYVEKAVRLALRGEVHAIVTAPLSKEAMNMAGYRYAGHTELIAHLTRTDNYAMMLAARGLRVIHVTTHVSMREACSQIKKDRVLRTILLANGALRGLGIEGGKIAVAGFNPHAGEAGLFGTEEIEEITPAVKEAVKSGMNVAGPFPPDTVFLRTQKGEFDIAVAMYHDQGHIPLKMVGFERGVNVTIGLPVIRTSVDHGTAYRRAALKLGTGDPTSLLEAIKLAAQMARAKFGS